MISNSLKSLNMYTIIKEPKNGAHGNIVVSPHTGNIIGIPDLVSIQEERLRWLIT